MKSQLTAAGYAPRDITCFALSHDHFDHTANANAFAGATWIVQQSEREAMFAEKPGLPPLLPHMALPNTPPPRMRRVRTAKRRPSTVTITMTSATAA